MSRVRERVRERQIQVTEFVSIPIPRKTFDEYKTESLITDDRFKIDLEVEPRPVKYVTNDVIQPVLSLPTKYIEGEFTIVDEKEFEDYLQREIREPLRFHQAITIIDFTRPSRVFTNLESSFIVFSRKTCVSCNFLIVGQLLMCCLYSSTLLKD